MNSSYTPHIGDSVAFRMSDENERETYGKVTGLPNDNTRFTEITTGAESMQYALDTWATMRKV